MYTTSMGLTLCSVLLPKFLLIFLGSLLVHVSWTNTQSSQDVSVSGYRVLVDGKQFGTTLHSGVNNVRIKLNLESHVHRISMVTVSAKPYGISGESNTVDVLTTPFRPFVAFCYQNLHQQDSRFVNILHLSHVHNLSD